MSYEPDTNIKLCYGHRGMEEHFESNGQPVTLTRLYLNYSWLAGYYEAYQARREQARREAEFDEEYDRWLEMVDLDNTLAEMTGRD